MKKALVCIGLIAVCLSCKDNPKKTTEIPEPTVAELIAEAHGYKHWDKVSEIQFRFGKNRLWNWNLTTDAIKLTTKKDTIQYYRRAIDSVSQKADRAFINDKFWLLIPFQLVWDDIEYTVSPMETAPISKQPMSKMVVTYPQQGGYTPGDAYDIYFDENYIIREWVFRRGNKKEPSLINTFENYKDFEGIKIAQDHTRNNGKPMVKLSDIKITLK
ncbi:hypothetical protein [Seonamhaeicola sp. ML3]|uniref:hypothetical protein n=1 Tax=Seonamhaeicola sp. ML3 TaxID=2937786 RepID=UPI00200EE582|nr:hypothetical protein [Seonamhaeicola sp. ML3]